jgi:flagellar hook-associated protein 1 FlgK
MSSPVSTFFGLQTTLRGLLAQQRAVDVTSHNVANANTQGYSRQEAVLEPTAAFDIRTGALVGGGGGQLGSGVDVASYQRIRDGFLDLQYRAQAMNQGQWGKAAETLSEVESGLNEPGDNGINAQLGKFWSAWGDVANAPESTATRQALVSQAGVLASQIKDLDSQISAISTQATAEYASLTGSTGTVQQDANEINKLNGAIRQALDGGGSPNDLMDRRDQLLDDLSQLAQVSVTNNSDGTVDVQFGDAANPLVDSTGVHWPQTLTTPGGKLGAILNLTRPGGTLDGYHTTLNAFAKQLADSVNALHNPGGTGTNFFTYTAGSAAATIAVNVTASTVVASTTANPGANDVALAIAGLRGGGADTSYQGLISQIGSDVNNAQRQSDSAQALTTAVDDRRQSTSGVSMDEEMTNLVKFQRAYQASARAMSSVDEMLDVLINRTGKVGL